MLSFLGVSNVVFFMISSKFISIFVTLISSSLYLYASCIIKNCLLLVARKFLYTDNIYF
jgi:hypothetical protein